jgi:hypothetical protein
MAVVRATEIEKHKENIQPIKSGRSAAVTVRRLQSNDTAVLGQQRQTFEKQLVEDAENAVPDPLVTWYSYIVWARVIPFYSPFFDFILIRISQDNYPRSSDVMKTLLQRCTKQYGMDGRYQDNLMMLQLWIMLADTMTNPIILYHYLKVRN